MTAVHSFSHIHEVYHTYRTSMFILTCSINRGPTLSANFEAISLVVTTADTGCPFPIGLPIVTMSGTTPVL